MLVDIQEGEFRTVTLAGQNCVNAPRVRPRVYRVSYCPRQIAYNTVRVYIASCISSTESLAKIRLESTVKCNNINNNVFNL